MKTGVVNRESGGFSFYSFSFHVRRTTLICRTSLSTYHYTVRHINKFFWSVHYFDFFASIPMIAIVFHHCLAPVKCFIHTLAQKTRLKYLLTTLQHEIAFLLTYHYDTCLDPLCNQKYSAIFQKHF